MQPAAQQLSLPLVGELPPEKVLFGRSAGMQELKRKLSQTCLAGVPVLLQGEIGVGKKAVSRFIHQRWFAAKGHYVRINCARIDGLWAPFVFCAVLKCRAPAKIRPGEPVERIATLFLDEVNELPIKLQRSLANLLIEHNDERNFNPHRGPLCIVSSSTRDLRYETEEGRFLKDLLQQLAVVTLEVPTLHDRAQDLPAICDFLHRRCCRTSGMPDRPFPSDLLEYMRVQRWPGNLGELETFISRFVAPA